MGGNCPDFRKDFDTFSHSPDIQGRMLQLGGLGKVNLSTVFKSKQENPGNYKTISITLIPRKLMEQLILETIFMHGKDKKIIRSGEHSFP